MRKVRPYCFGYVGETPNLHEDCIVYAKNMKEAIKYIKQMTDGVYGEKYSVYSIKFQKINSYKNPQYEEES